MAVAGMNQLDIRVADNYRLVRILGAGGWSLVYLASDVRTGADVAVKIETGHTNLLETEARFYKMLGNGQGIPKLHWFGVEGDFRAIVFGFLGPSLRDLLHYCGRPFSLKTVLMLADQLICRLRHIHSKKIIHCDVTPANCLMGVGREGNTVYLTDFGISHLYNPTYNPERGHMRGTVKFLSRNGQRGFEQSRRDDMESLGYTLIHLLHRLPWEYTSNDDTTLQLKDDNLEELCEGLPEEFKVYMDHVRNLGYAEAPRYDYLRRLFQRAFKRNNYTYDKVFDWTKSRYLEG